jgi:exodeoxyribonuclease VII small subunit
MEDFEDKLKEAKELLDKLNNPEIPLKEAMECYKRGVKLLKEASEIIQKAKLEFEEIKSN